MQSSPSLKQRVPSGGQPAPSRSPQQTSSSAQPQPNSSQCFVPQSSPMFWSPGPSSTEGQGSMSCPWKRSTASKCPMTSFSQPSPSPESPTVPQSRSGSSASQSPSAPTTTTAPSSSTLTSSTSACRTTPSSGSRRWPSSWP